MDTANSSFGLRIIIAATLLGMIMIGLVTYQTYSKDIQEHFSQKLVELMPDMENSLAQL